MRNSPFESDQATSELSESVFFQPTTSPGDKTISRPGGQIKPLGKKYTTHLTLATIRAVKRYAFEHHMKAYEVVQLALDEYLEHQKQADGELERSQK